MNNLGSQKHSKNNIHMMFEDSNHRHPSIDCMSNMDHVLAEPPNQASLRVSQAVPTKPSDR